MQVISHLKNMEADRFLHIYESLETQGFGPLDGEVAKIMKFRPQAIRKLPMAQRAKRAKSFVEQSSNTELAYELFGTYLLKVQKELVTGFLDATGVEHDDGMIDNLEDSAPKVDKLGDVIKDLDGKFDKDDVTLYLSMCSEQWPETTELAAAYETRA